MWLFAMFDLPVTTKKARKAYHDFRKALIGEGFSMLQYSVYARYCASEDRSEVFKRRLQPLFPPEGQVRLMAVTDHQFGKMEVFSGKKELKPEKKPDQMLFF